MFWKGRGGFASRTGSNGDAKPEDNVMLPFSATPGGQPGRMINI